MTAKFVIAARRWGQRKLGSGMDVEDALEEYVDMLTAGSQALQRLAKRELDQPHAAELCELIEGILDHAASLKAAVGRTPTALQLSEKTES